MNRVTIKDLQEAFKIQKEFKTLAQEKIKVI